MEIIEEPKAQMTIQSSTFRLSVRFEYILFPIDVTEFMELLAEAGYGLTTTPPNIVGKPVRLTVKGKIAQKGDTQIELNDDRGVIAIIGTSPNSVIQSMAEILTLINSKLNVDIPEKAIFYEFIGGLDVKTGKNAIEVIERVSEHNAHIEKMGKILGQDVSNFSLKLVPTAAIPSSPDWMEMTIEPNIIKPSLYRVIIVYRKKDRTQVESFASLWLDNLSKLISTIES